MAENTVDNVVLEIESSTKEADAGLDELASALVKIRNALKTINVSNLTALKNAINDFQISTTTVNDLNTFSNAVKRINDSINSTSLDKGKAELTDYTTIAKKGAEEIGKTFGLTQKNVKNIGDTLSTLATSSTDNTFQEKWIQQLSTAIWESRRIYDVWEKDYGSFLGKVAEMNRGSTKVVLKDLLPDLKEDWADAAKLLGKNFVLDVPRDSSKYISATQWVQDIMPKENPADAMQIILDQIRDSSGYAFTKGAAEANQFNESIEMVNVALSTLLSKLGFLKIETENGIIDTSAYQQKIATNTGIPDLYKWMQQAAGEEERLSTISKQLTSPLKDIVTAANGLDIKPETGTSLMDIGKGFASISKSIDSIKGIPTEKITEITSAVNAIGGALSGIGSNNKINIKVSAEGVKAVKQPIEEIKQQLGDIANANLNLGEGAEELSTPFEGAKEILDGIEKTTEQIVSETKTFAESIADVGKNFKTLNWGKDLKKEIEQTEKRFDTLLQKEQKMLAMGNVDENSNTWKSLQYDITECANKLDILYDKQDREWAITEGFDEARKKAERLKQEILEIMKAQEEAKGKKLNLGELFSEDNVLSTLNMIQTGLRMIGSGFNSVSQSAREASVTFKNVQSTLIGFLKIITTPVRLFGNSLSKQIKGLTAQFANMSKKVQAHLKKMSDFWKRTMRTFTFMVVRKAITAILGDMKEAVDSLALWSKNFGTPFNDSISSIVADFKYMGKAILAAVEPLINAVAPIIAKLAEWFGTLAGKVAEFMAAITGQSYWMKAKKNVTDYSDSVNKANKATKGALQGFDELNNITTQNNSDTGLNLDKVKNDWEKMPVSEKAKEWADKIKQIFADLWEPIGKAWDRMKDYVLGGWKYMTGEIKSLAKDMWDDFIEVWKQEATVKIFENIFGMIGDIEYGIGNLVKNFHEAWNEGETGKHILENIRDIVGILVEHARNVTKYFKEWSKGVTFDNLLKSVERLTASLKKVADFIGGEFEDVMILGVMTFIEWFIEEGLPKINNAIANVIDAFDFDKIREDLKPVISGAEKLLEHLFAGATDGAESLGLKIANWFNSDKFTKFTTALTRVMAVFTEDRIATVIDGIGTGLLRIADAVIAIASSDAVIGIFEAIGSAIDKLGASGIANIVDGLVVAIAGFGALAGVAGVIALITAKLSKLFITLAGATAVIANGTKLFKWLNEIGALKSAGTVLSKIGKGIGEIASQSKLLTGAGNIIKSLVTGLESALFSADIGASISASLASGDLLAAGTTAGTTIAAGVVAAIAGYNFGKWGSYVIAKMFGDTETADLYKNFNLAEGIASLNNENQSAVEDGKDIIDGYIKMVTDFKDNPAIAWLTTGVTVAGTGPLAPLILGFAHLKKATEDIDLSKVKEDVTGLVEESSGAFELWGQDIENGFLAIANAQEETITPMVDKVKTKFTEMKDNAISLKDDLKGAWDLMAADISTWYTEQVAPWFTVEKWMELGENIKTAIKTKWDETVGQWITDITTWWDTNVAPWFTQEKWTEVLSSIEPAFKEAFKGAVNVAIEALNKLLEGIEKMINEALGADGLGKIGEYASKVGIELDLNFSPVKIPRIPKFEKGGFPEDGLFYANHNELIGNFNNGRTAVANNGQIIDGISSGVEMANAQQNSLLSEMISLLGVIADKDLTIGDDAIFSSYQRGSARYAKRYGI